MRARSLASDGGEIKYLARLRLAMVDEQDSVGGARCFFLDLVGLDLGAEQQKVERKVILGRRERSRLKPVRFTGGSSDDMGGRMCAYAVDLRQSGL